MQNAFCETLVSVTVVCEIEQPIFNVDTTLHVKFDIEFRHCLTVESTSRITFKKKLTNLICFKCSNIVLDAILNTFTAVDLYA